MSRATLEASVRRRVGQLVRSCADPQGSRPKDRELATYLKALRKLDPAYDARVRALAGLDRPAQPATSRKVRVGHATSPITRTSTTVKPLFNVSDVGGYHRTAGA